MPSSVATTLAIGSRRVTQAHFTMTRRHRRFSRFTSSRHRLLLVQLLMTSRVLRRFGIGPGLFLVPLALLLGTTAVVIFGTLWAAIVLRGSDQVLRYSIDKSSVELLYLPVAPGIKLAVKSFIDTVVWRLGDGLAGIALLLVATWGGLSARQVSWVNLVFILGWIAVALVARREYVDTLRESILQHRLDTELFSPQSGPLGPSCWRPFRGHDPQEILYALGLLETGQPPGGASAVRGTCSSIPSGRGAHRALAILNAAGDLSVRGRVEELLRDPH